jgi:hypothetical protein
MVRLFYFKQRHASSAGLHLSPALWTLQGSPLKGLVSNELTQAQHTERVPAAQLCYRPITAILKLV